MSSTFAQINSKSSFEKPPLRSLVFIDSGVEDYESITAGVLPGQQVVILDRTKNGIEQITSEMEKYASTKGALDSVHIISHGSSGSLQLGNTALGSDNIEQYKSQLEKWQTSLAPQADIMLYGCDVAGGTGANFVDRFSQLTGADVAASTNITGRGGDWNLEFAKGQIDSPLALQPEAMASYQGDLATIVVANNSDSGPGSLRAAIATAVAGDIITFAPGLANQTITLTSGQLDIPVGKNITIDGAAAAGLTISGNNASRAFFVNANVATATDFVVKNLIITNGKTTDRGGAIGTTDEVNLTVENVQFNNNVADKGGGAIFGNFNNTLTVTNSKFNGNVATSANDERGAGAIGFLSFKTFTVTNSDFTNNKGINGGAINSLQGKLTIDNSRFIGNDTTAAVYATGQDNPFLRGFGGAVYTDRASNPSEASGTIKITNSVFQDNKGRGEGGAAYLFTGSQDKVILEKSTFQNNEILALPNGGNAGNGGGVTILSDSTNQGLTITNTTFAGNKAGNQGGGLWMRNAPTTITNSTFSGNSTAFAAGDFNKLGGAMTLGAPTTILNTTIADNSAGWVGGGIFADANNVTLKNTILSNNTAANGGNPWGIQQHATAQYSDQGGNFQWPLINTDTKVTTSITIADPLLGPLQNLNGALVRPLLTGSPAIDTGIATGAPATDQRGVARPQDGDSIAGAIVDSGSFELGGSVVPAPTPEPTPTPTPEPAPTPTPEPAPTPTPEPAPTPTPEPAPTPTPEPAPTPTPEPAPTPTPEPAPTPTPEPAPTPTPEPAPTPTPEPAPTPTPEPAPTPTPEPAPTPTPEPAPTPTPEPAPTPTPEPAPTPTPEPAPTPEPTPAPTPTPEPAPTPEPTPAPTPTPPTPAPTPSPAPIPTETPTPTPEPTPTPTPEPTPTPTPEPTPTPTPEPTPTPTPEPTPTPTPEPTPPTPEPTPTPTPPADDCLLDSLNAPQLDPGAITPNPAQQTINGGEDTDFIMGGVINESINGQAGNDTLYGMGGNDNIDGGADNDSIFGNAGSDFIFGGAGNDTIYAGKDNDTVVGGEGDDLLRGDLGNDTVAGGVGNDSIFGGKDDDILLGEDGDDYILGNLGNDTINTGNGNDIAFGNEGADLIFGDLGNDTLYGGKENDSLDGGEGNDLLLGGNQNDVLCGDMGNDTLYGGKGNDILSGGAGDDFLSGDVGEDTLTGGSGNDVFFLNQSSGSEIINDFRKGEDLIGLNSGVSFNQLSITSSNNQTLITVTDTNQLLAKLNGITPGILTASDFTQVTI